jgi:hypothetical protein
LLTHLPGPVPLPRAHSPAPNPAGTTRLPLAVTTMLLVLCLILPVALPAAAQEATPLQVASGPLSERTMVLVGRTVQTPEQLQFFGYLNAASGLTGQDLFADDTDQVSAARFTFSAAVALQPPINRADTTSFSGAGTLRIYLATDGGADWNDPTTFSAGEVVAEYDLALQETLQRQAANVGVLVGDGTLTQATANAFTLEGTPYRFGVEGLGQRLRYTGALTPETSGATLAAGVNGYAEVTNRSVTVVRMGQTTSTAATPAPAAEETPAATAACALEPWLGTATAALSLADQGISGLDLSSPDAVDVAAVQTLAAQIDAAIATQRGSAPPEDATAANRLLVTALSTTARGLRGIASAVADGNEVTFSQAADALDDGQTLLAQAQVAITDLAATCPAG